jgi:hypothetical protein
MNPEEKLVRQYFELGEGTITEHELMRNRKMMEHMNWHELSENKTKSGNYGERFLLFHKEFIEKFDTFRISKHYLPFSSWDPSTIIPASLAHEGYIEKRYTDSPYSIDPLCKTPTWLTIAGGSEPDPIYGYTSLYQFRSTNELGFAIDPIGHDSWHNRIHNTIGGDMAKYHSPIDPIFWPWHKWIDEIRATWQLSRMVLAPNRGWLVEKMVRLLLDPAISSEKTAPGPHFRFLSHDSGPTMDVFMGLIMNQISYELSDSESSEVLQKTAVKLLNNAVQRIAIESSNTKAEEIQQKPKIRKKKRTQH